MLDSVKKYTGIDLTNRINLLWFELEKQCAEFNSNEFEYSWEMWGVMWMPWFIMIDHKLLNFSANDISSNDLEILVKQGKIEVIKIYETHERKEEFEKIRYRIIKSQTTKHQSEFQKNL
ncbi:hypothetical protein [Flavobacterium quisquiliarum]|uniref:Uncharacterized protein n=1 Tax=Flavobacterium quisquiliarum TaxID=1834436 RepID=A0ABV8W6H1_9FLAO|nr:hypothetical protein [Flavobacterium quisquiliarum]MBW1656486.1 hypothetical protein [Flavobacterium quisquiliarum]NWL03845.1 hypothetical protein [Flavobacterium collinsii]